jgi:hypothetical protein
MDTFCITFRIHNDAGYSDRYNSTVEATKRCCHGAYWDEPTSFFLFENPSSATKIGEWILANSDFAASKDMMLVTNLSQKDAVTIGHIKSRDTLNSLMQKR